MSLIDRWVASFVMLGDLFIPAGAIPHFLKKYSDSLLEHTRCQNYEARTIGSCSLVHFNGRYLAVCTRHQVEVSRADPEYLALISERHKTFNTSGGFISVRPVPYPTEIHDTAFLDFTQPVNDGNLESGMFFNLEARSILRNGERIIALQVIGYPYLDQKFEVNDDEVSSLREIGLRQRCLACKCDGPTSDPDVLRLSFMSPPPGYDGLSGSPVFAIVEEGPFRFAIRFAGMITRAGAGYGYFLHSPAIVRILSSSAFGDGNVMICATTEKQEDI